MPRRPSIANPRSAGTRERLLAAAERHFARRGYRAPLRDITREGRCNAAAVNYHFGTKLQLYQEVVLGLLVRLREQHLAALAAVPEGAALEELLASFGSAYLRSLSGGEQAVVAWQLLQQEALARLLPPGMLHGELVEPVQRAVETELRGRCPGLAEADARVKADLILGQLQHLICPKRLDSPAAAPPEVLLADWVRVTAATLRALATTGAAAARRRARPSTLRSPASPARAGSSRPRGGS